jgi:hypothetical protein
MSGEFKVNFSPPLSRDDLRRLQLFCRYPEGLTSERREKLFQYYGQRDFLRFN